MKRKPRLVRLSAAVLVNQRADTPLTDDEVKKLTELSRRAVGFDEERGDLIELTTATFVQAAPTADAPLPPGLPLPLPLNTLILIGAGALALVVLGAIALLVLRRKKSSSSAPMLASSQGATPALPPGSTTLTAVVTQPQTVRDHARKAALEDPDRATRLLVAWLEPPAVEDGNRKEASRAR